MNRSEQALRCLISLLEEQCIYAADESEHVSTHMINKIIKHICEDFEGAFTANINAPNCTWVGDKDD